MNLKRILIPAVIIGGAAGIFLIPPDIRNSVLDRSEPEIGFEMTKILGASTQQVTVSDGGSGLREAMVIVEQNGQSTEIAKRLYEQGERKDTLTFSPGEKRGVLKEGPAKLVVQATDKSLWSNAAKKELEVIVDFASPRIELLTLQHIVAQGGVELVIYKASDTTLSRHGVKVGETFFPGFRIGLLDPELDGQADLYAAFYSIPLGFDSDKSRPKLEAEDSGGNRVGVDIHFRLDRKPQQSADMKLSDAFLQSKIPPLYESYRAAAGAAGVQTDQLPEQFTLVNGDYRKLLDEQLYKIFRENGTAAAQGGPRPKLWKEVFIKPMGSATSSTFGEKRTYFHDGKEIGRSIHNGFDLASVANDLVRAANDGVTIFSGDHGIYGNTVLIDHGLGLFSLYGHLSSALVNAGDTVARGQDIGRTGQTGLAGGDHLHFEFRLLEAPVAAIEWWDPKWIKDNIEGKLADVKEMLGATRVETEKES